MEKDLKKRTLLNVGAGHPDSKASIPKYFQGETWKEVRLDIEPDNKPDILGDMLDMSLIPDFSIDAIYSSHNIEHLYFNEIHIALREFRRVLKPDGFIVVTCPDLQSAAEMIVEGKLLDTAYESPFGPVTPFDIVYSHRKLTGREQPYMAHHSGFTLTSLKNTLKQNGFAFSIGKRRKTSFDLWYIAAHTPMGEKNINHISEQILP